VITIENINEGIEASEGEKRRRKERRQK